MTNSVFCHTLFSSFHVKKKTVFYLKITVFCCVYWFSVMSPLFKAKLQNFVPQMVCLHALTLHGQNSTNRCSVHNLIGNCLPLKGF